MIPPDLQDRVRGDHAGRTETALMLHVAPDAVDLSALRPGDHWYAWQPGRLVELDPANTAEAARRAREAGLDGVEVVTGDASVTDAYVGAVPADLVLACGIFGNVPGRGRAPHRRAPAPALRARRDGDLDAPPPAAGPHAADPGVVRRRRLRRAGLRVDGGGAARARRVPRIARPIGRLGRRTADGVPYVAPEVQLLFKARGPLPKDEADFAAALPLLDDEARGWLADALALHLPGHPWLDRLRRP